ncbi:MAG: RNA polymerase sigma-70 factor [Bacteroidales bacterium]|jgi:RNA polymerase sigma-70 factor (ECF subfamily)|nr:RNA polymerase sigma-70 factor [Bacteroidales bacterium]
MATGNENDLDLLGRIQKGDSHAFGLLFGKYYAPLCLWAVKFVHDMDTARDLVQDLFVYIWENREKLVIGQSVKAYLTTSVRYNCVRYLHKQSSGVSIDLLAESKEIPDCIYDALELEDLYRQLMNAIERLPEQCKKIFKLHRFEDLTYAEIAARLQISVKTVEAQMGKALKLLRSADYDR